MLFPFLSKFSAFVFMSPSTKSTGAVDNRAKTNHVNKTLAPALDSEGVIAQQLLRTVDGKRAAALEIMVVNTAISNLIREAKTFQIPSIIQTAKGDGMQLMDQALQALLAAKKISPDEAYRYAANKSLFQAPKN